MYMYWSNASQGRKYKHMQGLNANVAFNATDVYTKIVVSVSFARTNRSMEARESRNNVVLNGGACK